MIAILALLLAGLLPGNGTIGHANSPPHFTICHTGGGYNCVVDGDTAWIAGVKVRLTDIDAPETHQPRCRFEAELGTRATLRLQSLMNQGPFSLETSGRDRDRYGRRLRRLVRGGVSLGDVLVREGLARPYAGGRRSWCDGRIYSQATPSPSRSSFEA